MIPQSVLWHHDQLAEGVEQLARATGLIRGSANAIDPARSSPVSEPKRFDDWLNVVSNTMGLEAEAVCASYSEVDSMLSAAAPAVLEVHIESEPRYLLLCGSVRGRIKLLRPDGRAEVVAREQVCRLLFEPLEAPIQSEIDSVLTDAGIRGKEHSQARQAVLRRQLAHQTLDRCWLLRLPPSAHFGHQLRQDGIIRRLGSVLSLHALQQGLFALAWLMIGRGILQGHVDFGYFLVWLLLMASIVPIRLIQNWLQAKLVYRAAALLKQRLLSGVLQFDPARLRKEGLGRLLARVIESSAVENVMLTGGVLTILAFVEILSTAVVLLWAPRPFLFVALLAVWMGLTAVGTWRYIRDRRGWTISRLDMTEDLVEKLVAQRTRIAQEQPGRWHDGEDEQLENYLRNSKRMDQAAVGMSMLARGWLIAGLAVLSSGLAGQDVSMGQFAVGLGGVLMGVQALTRFNAGLGNLTTAFIASRRIIPLFQAGGSTESAGIAPSSRLRESKDLGDMRPFLEMQDVSFAYPGRATPVLDACKLSIASADRILVKGPSGSGKSTMAKILAGILPSDSGLMILNGLDLFTTGRSTWRRQVSYVPQHHENHIVTGSLAFNLLMGRSWPPSPDDLRDAEAVCRELGLNDLIRRMPAGLMQVVGETGWQLSHGEKSRVYLARSLLVEPEVVVADEALAALDPATTRQCLSALVNRKGALVLVAHA